MQKGAKNTINISNDVFLSNSLVLPYDDEEIERLTNLLSSLDDLITAQFQKTEALKRHKQGLMQGLFPAAADSSQ